MLHTVYLCLLAIICTMVSCIITRSLVNILCNKPLYQKINHYLHGSNIDDGFLPSGAPTAISLVIFLLLILLISPVLA